MRSSLPSGAFYVYVTITHTADVTSDTADSSTANNSATQTTTIINAVADLTLTMTDAPDPFISGGNITYTMSVKNNGPATATAVRVTDALPTSLRFVSATATQGTCQRQSATIICDLGNLANNQIASIELIVTATATGSVTNTASVTATEVDSATANNTGRQSTQLLAMTAFSLTPTTVTSGCQTLLGKVTLNIAAPINGVEVRLANSNAALRVPPSVTIPSGATSATFNVSTVAAAAQSTAIVTASLGTINKTAKITLRPIVIQTLAVNPLATRGGSSLTGTVTLACTPLAGNTTVALSTSNAPLAQPSVPSVTIPAGSATATFTINTVAVSNTRYLYINASAGGVTRSVKVKITP